ncbi:hypothetical protein KC726_01210 [Candidatus Woesebacteria bacterium]|nr:hypothetical protein [Candidatus Woesebacteria bacterium]
MTKLIIRILSTCLFFIFVTSVFAQTPTTAPTISPREKINISTDGLVATQTQTGNDLFIGGTFNKLAIENGTPVQRRNLAEVFVDTEIVGDWQPQPDNTVEALALYQKTLIVGGKFTNISATQQPYLAFFDIDKKFLLKKDLAPDAPVLALALDGDLLYVGGEFKNVNGASHQYVFAYDLAGNTITSWDPHVNAPVEGIVIEEGVIKLITVGAAADSGSKNIIVEKAGAAEKTDGKTPQPTTEDDPLSISVGQLGFKIPTLSDVLTFAVRAFFAVSGLIAMFYLLLGAIAWITSGGDKDKIQAARDKIQAALIGVVMTVVVLGLTWTMEQVVFNRRICFGLSCPLTIPSILEPT